MGIREDLIREMADCDRFTAEAKVLLARLNNETEQDQDDDEELITMTARQYRWLLSEYGKMVAENCRDPRCKAYWGVPVERRAVQPRQGGQGEQTADGDTEDDGQPGGE